jgi:four helix bundle protein
MPSIADELAARVMRFAVRVLRFSRRLPGDVSAAVIAKQLVRSGTGTSANYRAARRGRSRAEFIAKLGIVVEEADETLIGSR